MPDERSLDVPAETWAAALSAMGAGPLRAFDDFLVRYGQDAGAEEVAGVLLRKAETLVGMGRTADASTVYEELERRFSGESDAGVRMLIERGRGQLADLRRVLRSE